MGGEIKFSNKHLDKIEILSLSALLRNCYDANKKVTVQKDHKNPRSETFDLYYNYFKNPEKHTIIFLQGGPGIPFMSNVWAITQMTHFNQFNLLLIDPRGVGCNLMKPGDVPQHALSTEQTAIDLVEIIKKEDLKNYSIYGSSYGTYLATVLTSFLNNRYSDLEQPRTLFLEATLGSPIPGDGGYLFEGAKIANQLLSEHPGVKSIVLSNPSQSDFWADFIGDAFRSQVRDPVTEDIVFKWDLLLRAESELKEKGKVSQELLTWFQEEFDDFNERSQKPLVLMEAEDDDYLGESIRCTELETSSPGFYKYQFSSESLIIVPEKGLSDEDPCKNHVYKGFELGSYPILKTPTVYFHGRYDPISPLSKAQEHYELNRAEKLFIEVDHAGHSPVNTTLSTCIEDMLKQFTEGNFDLSDILNERGRCL